MYHGIAEIYQDNLDGFLAVAEEFQLRGLTGDKREANEHKNKVEKKPTLSLMMKIKPTHQHSTICGKSKDTTKGTFAKKHMVSHVESLRGRV